MYVCMYVEFSGQGGERLDEGGGGGGRGGEFV